MIKIVFSLILIFLYYLICICIYIIYSNIKNRRIYKKVDFINNEVYKLIQIETENLKVDKDINKKNMNKLKRKLSSKDYQRHIIKYLLSQENKDEIIIFLNRTKITELIFNQKESDEFDKAYKIYIIGEFNMQNHYQYLIDSTESDSIYIQINSLKALSKLGDKKNFIIGLKNIISSSSLIHEKVLTDVLYQFYKNDKELNKALKEELKNKAIELNKVIINHFINTKYEGAKEIICDLLEDNDTDKEIKIACLKYFADIKYLKAKDILIKLLKDESWEIRAVSANALKDYKYKEVILSLQESIKDKVWYVRQNSAKSLYNLVNKKDELQSIINGSDKYASDSIISIYSEEN